MSSINLSTKWQALKQYQPGGEQAGLFIAKLQLQQGWSREFCIAAIEEYKRFVFLASESSRPISPSTVVDDVWHLHLTFSRCYWNSLCGHILGKDLHHDPTEPSEASERGRDPYQDTLRAYSDTFGEEAPEEFWPQAKGEAGRGKKKGGKRLSLAGAGALLGLSAASWGNGLSSNTGEVFLGFIVFIAVLFVVALVAMSSGSRSGMDSRRGKGKSGGGISSRADGSGDCSTGTESSFFDRSLFGSGSSSSKCSDGGSSGSGGGSSSSG